MDLSGALKLSKASSPACRIGLLCPPPATPRVWSHLEAIIGTTGAPATAIGYQPACCHGSTSARAHALAFWVGIHDSSLLVPGLSTAIYFSSLFWSLSDSSLTLPPFFLGPPCLPSFLPSTCLATLHKPHEQFLILGAK